jgi:hypothetical protein
VRSRFLDYVVSETLAVLPLEPYDQLQAESSGLGIEIAESLVAVLSRRPDLHVMALSSTDYYRSEVNSVKDIAGDLQVSHSLDCSNRSPLSPYLVTRPIPMRSLPRRAPYWNILGMVQYHLGDYVASREALLENLRRGGPQSPVLRLYLPAALARTGRPEAAADMVAEAKGDPSIIGAQHWTYRNFKDKQEFERLLSVLETLGMQRSAALAEN